MPVPTKQGYTFSGWYYDSKLSVPANDYIPAGSFGDKQLYAKWKGNIYAAAFDLNDNQEDPANGPSMKDVIYGKSFTFDIPYRNGFIFNGWKDSNGIFYTGSDGKSTKYWDIAGNTILYADWIRETYYIKIDANGHIFWMTNNDIKEESDKTGIEYGTEFLTIDELLSKFNPYKQGPNGQYKESLKEGYKFLYFTETQPPVNGWGSTIPSQFTAWDKAPKLGENEAEITIYAYFVPEMNFNLVFIGESIQSGINPVTSKFNADINLVIPQKREYARFIRWKVADVNENRIFDNTYLRVGQIFDFTKMPDLSIGREEDGTSIWLESVWVPLATITFSTGYGTVPSAFNKIDLGTYITLPILSCTGRTFHGWYSDSNGSGVKFTSGAWNKQGLTALYAYWTTNKYSITYTLNGGSHSGNPTNYTVDDNIILKDAEQTGYRFMGWYGDSSFTGNRIYSIPQGSIEDFTLYANFKVLYSITLILEGFDYATYSKIYGETIHLPSPVKGGYKASWGEYSFGSYYVVTQSKTFNAYWTEKTLDECYNSSTRFYEIFTYNQLNTIRDKSTYGYTGSGYEPYISGNFKLMVSVYFSGYWTPIPYNFRGTFDGNNNCINNMKISTESNGDFGFFERIYYGTVRNLNLYNVYIYGSSTNSSDAFLNVGAVAGTNGYGNISNCTVKGTITVYTYKNARIGGIVGYNYSYAEITNCDNYATINGYRNIGGIAGENHYSAITFCDNYGNINFYYNSGNGAVGGIVGHNRYSGNVANCINKGTIKYASSSSNNKNIAPCMAQIIGLNESGNYSNNTCSGNTDFTNLKTNAGAVFGIGGVNQRRYCSNGELGRKI